MALFASLKLPAAAVHRLGRTVLVCALPFALAACAQKPASHQPQWRVAGPTANMHPGQVAPRELPRLQVEEDGLPEQMPPSITPGRPVNDDPTEPFSPNYGTVPVDPKPVGPVDLGALDGLPVVPAAVRGAWAGDILPEDLPADLPPDFRSALLNSRR